MKHVLLSWRLTQIESFSLEYFAVFPCVNVSLFWYNHFFATRNGTHIFSTKCNEFAQLDQFAPTCRSLIRPQKNYILLKTLLNNICRTSVVEPKTEHSTKTHVIQNINIIFYSVSISVAFNYYEYVSITSPYIIRAQIRYTVLYTRSANENRSRARVFELEHMPTYSHIDWFRKRRKTNKLNKNRQRIVIINTMLCIAAQYHRNETKQNYTWFEYKPSIWICTNIVSVLFHVRAISSTNRVDAIAIAL